MRWIDLEREQPELATVVRRKLIEPGVLLVGTTRKDASARISGVEPLLMDGKLWVSMMDASTKARDLYRDPRIVLHSIVTGPEAGSEVKVRGSVRCESDLGIHERYAEKVRTDIGWQPVVGDFALFALDIDDVTCIAYDDSTGAQHVARWPANLEYVRPTISPTKLGPPQPIRRLTRRSGRRLTENRGQHGGRGAVLKEDHRDSTEGSSEETGQSETASVLRARPVVLCLLRLWF